MGFVALFSDGAVCGVGWRAGVRDGVFGWGFCGGKEEGVSEWFFSFLGVLGLVDVCGVCGSD